MVVSRPCLHPDTPERPGFIRGQYQSVEFIREIPIEKRRKKSASMTDLLDVSHSRKRSDSTALGRGAMLRNAKKAGEPSLDEGKEAHSEGRPRGKTISFDMTRRPGAKEELRHGVGQSEEDDESEMNPVEWIMLTRSDPGGSVPKFMVERGTPGSIVADASKFLDWACAKDIDEFHQEAPKDRDEATREELQVEEQGDISRPKVLHNYDTNGHLAGVENSKSQELVEADTDHQTGLYSMMASAGATVASYTPNYITNRLPGQQAAVLEDLEARSPITRHYSTSSSSSSSSDDSFMSASEGDLPPPHFPQINASSQNSDANSTFSSRARRMTSQEDKELQKHIDRKRKLDEKLANEVRKENAKKSEDPSKESAVIAAIAKAQEKHKREIEKQDQRYRKETEKLEQKRLKEEKKAEEKVKKAMEKDEKVKFARDLDVIKAELDAVRLEREALRTQVEGLQGENKALVARVAALGAVGIVGGGGLGQGSAIGNGNAGAVAEGKEKENVKPAN